MTTVQAGRGRVAVVDVARGLALCGMVVFHGAWDLHHFGLFAVDPSRSPGWQALGHVVATTFLALSGVNLVLADRRGADAASHMRRLAIVAGAAALVSGATWLVVPDEMVVFGILHCIVLSNAIALVLVRAPSIFVLAAAAAALLAPLLVPDGLPDWLWWVGLSSHVPDTLDYRPLLPWIAPVLFGMALGRVSFQRPSSTRASAQRRRWLAGFGRHSLSIYLLHQPVIFGVLMLAMTLAPNLAGPPRPGLDAEGRAAFLTTCVADCGKQGADDAFCGAVCRCVLDRRPPSIGRSGPLASTAVAACLRSAPVIGAHPVP